MRTSFIIVIAGMVGLYLAGARKPSPFRGRMSSIEYSGWVLFIGLLGSIT